MPARLLVERLQTASANDHRARDCRSDIRTHDAFATQLVPAAAKELGYKRWRIGVCTAASCATSHCAKAAELQNVSADEQADILVHVMTKSAPEQLRCDEARTTCAHGIASSSTDPSGRSETL